MPRPCAVVLHAYRYSIAPAHHLSSKREPPWRKAMASRKMCCESQVAASVRDHGTRPWHPEGWLRVSSSGNVNLHGARPWHLEDFLGVSVAVNVRNHGTRPWHPNQRSHSLNPSIRRITSLRFFSNIANMKMIEAPVTIPATYHNQVQPKFAEAYQISVTID